MNPVEWYRSRTQVPGHTERRSNSPWKKARDPQRILIIRLHAVGDVALTLPACLGLRKRYPHARIDFLSAPEADPMLRAVGLFNTVFPLHHTTGRTAEAREILAVGSQVRGEHYAVVLDLQRNWKSRWIRRLARADSWAEFDRFSPEPACDRTLRAFHEAGFQSLLPDFEHRLTQDALQSAECLLRSEGWQSGEQLIVLNPAGLWVTRNWPLGNYARLAQLWPGQSRVRFVLLGTERMRAASQFLDARLGTRLLDLTGRTSVDQAMAVLQNVDLVITEDSGLMHMAWSLGKPLIALFGSSRHYWSVPTGNHVRAFHSGDLPCGACMQPQCKYGDTRCLARVTPEVVLHAAEGLLRSSSRVSNF